MLTSTATYNINHGTVKVPWLTLVTCALALLLHLAGGALFNNLVFDKHAIANGEIWRIITGHFVHSDAEHFFWDVLALGVLGFFVELTRPKDFLPCLLFSCLAVSGFLLFSNISVLSYCGLSGALNGLLVLAVFIQWKETRSIVYAGIFFGTIAKIMYEFCTRQTLFANVTLQAVPEAHAVGLIAGIFYIIITNGILKVNLMGNQDVSRNFIERK